MIEKEKADSQAAGKSRASRIDSCSDDAIEQTLISGENRDLLEAYFGEQLYEELRGLAAREDRAGTGWSSPLRAVSHET